MVGTVGVLGAGAIGLFVGGHLSSQGIKVRFIGRSVLGRVAQAGKGLRLTDFERPGFRLQIDDIDARYEAGELIAGGAPDVLLVCVKSGDSSIVGKLAGILPTSCVVISLQNGVDNVTLIKEALPDHTVVAGMVPYGVNELEPGHFHRGTPGAIAFGPGAPSWLAEHLRKSGLQTDEFGAEDMRAVQWFKLVVNLQNALNALVGRPLGDCLQDRTYRRLLSTLWNEGLTTCRAANVPLHGKLNGRPLGLVAWMLLLPNFIFRLIFKPAASYRSSMFADLDQKRGTEIMHLQGRIVEVGAEVGVDCGVNRVLLELVKEAEAAKNGSPYLTPEFIAKRVEQTGTQLRQPSIPAKLLLVLLIGSAALLFIRRSMQ